MKKRVWNKLIAIVLPCLLLYGCGDRKSKGFKKEYKMQVNVGPTTYWGMGAAKFAELAAEKTGGKIKVVPYYGSQLLKGAQLNSSQMVAEGSINCAFESTINTAPVIPEMNIFCLPFFVNTYENLDKMEAGETGKYLFELMKQKGLMPLAWGENGFRQLTNSKRKVVKPEDLKGLKIRVVGSPVFMDIFSQLGANPVNMNWGDAVTAFQQGAVDGQENPAAILIAVQIGQYQKYATFWNYVIDPLILYWNKEEWEAFPPEIRKALQEAADEAASYEKNLTRAGMNDGKSLKILKEKFNYQPKITDPVQYLQNSGMEVSKLSEAEHKAFVEAVKPVFERWSKKVGDTVFSKAKKDMNR